MNVKPRKQRASNPETTHAIKDSIWLNKIEMRRVKKFAGTHKNNGRSTFYRRALLIYLDQLEALEALEQTKNAGNQPALSDANHNDQIQLSNHD